MDLGLTAARGLVFGSSSGLGKAVAGSLVREGAKVAIASRDEARARAATAETGAALPIVGDLAMPGAGARMVAEAVEGLGGLDICVINTGGGSPGGIMDTDGSDELAYHNMLRPALEVARAAAPHLQKSKQGRMLFLTARSTLEATPDLALSGVMRSGVTAAARSLAIELAPDVLVNVVATGQFDTPALERFERSKAERADSSTAEARAEHLAQIPLGRLGTAEEFADVVTFLCSTRSSFMTGTVIRVDGGAVRGF